MLGTTRSWHGLEVSVSDGPSDRFRGIDTTVPAAVTYRHLALDLVIQTASGVLTNRFGAREAVTLLASQAPQARAEAPLVAEREPDRAEAYAELLKSMVSALEVKALAGEEARDLRAVARELDRVVDALTG
jgi:3-polyprenyl-4-hydroxybenzoate decarboxylase